MTTTTSPVLLAAETLEKAPLGEFASAGFWRIGMTFEDATAFLEKHDGGLVPILARLRAIMDRLELFGPGRFSIGREYSRVIYVRLEMTGHLIDVVRELAEEFEADEVDFRASSHEYRIWWD